MQLCGPSAADGGGGGGGSASTAEAFVVQLEAIATALREAPQLVTELCGGGGGGGGGRGLLQRARAANERLADALSAGRI